MLAAVKPLITRSFSIPSSTRVAQIVEKLDSNEQNPERNPVLLTLGCERNTVMSNKHELEFLKTVGDAVSVPPILLGSKLLPLQIAVYYEGRNCHRRVSAQARKRKRTARAGAESCPDLAERKPCDRSRADNHPRATAPSSKSRNGNHRKRSMPRIKMRMCSRCGTNSSRSAIACP